MTRRTRAFRFEEPQGGWTIRHRSRLNYNQNFLTGVVLDMIKFALFNTYTPVLVMAVALISYILTMKGDMSWMEFLIWSQGG